MGSSGLPVVCNEPQVFPLLNRFFELPEEVKAILSIVTMLLVEPTIFVNILY
jgi:hypothetical protein